MGGERRCPNPECEDGVRIYDKENKKRWKCSSCHFTHKNSVSAIQSTSFFEDRKTQLTDSRNDIEPEGIPFIKEIIQNADDRKATEVCIVFSEKSIYISNNGITFNYNAEYEDIDGLLKPVKGDLCNICSVKGGNKADEDDTVGRHGTGFELVYCIGNQFEMHWWEKEFEENWSYRSNPEKLENPADVIDTWDKSSDSDLVELESPYYSNNEEMRGVLFKVDWRKKKGNKKFTKHLESIFSQDVFTQWDEDSRSKFFDECINYGPLMIQFCKSVLELKLFWIDDKESKTVEIVREKAYPTDEYRISGTHYSGVPKYKTEIVDISINSYSFQTKSIIDNINNIASKDLVKIIKLENKKILDQRQWKLFHGWSPIYATEYTQNRRGYINTKGQVSSWKIKQGKENYHICNSSNNHYYSDCFGGCPRKGKEEQWREDRTPIIHIHIPINDIGDDLNKLKRKGKTLLNSILPLAVTSSNRFMISADFYVQQTRRLVEHNETTTGWNICAAKTSFWLHSQMKREISEEVVDYSEIFLLQSTMAKPEEWFASMGIAPDKWPDEELFLGEEKTEENYFDYTTEKWLIDRDNRLVGLKEIIIPTSKDEIYDEKLAQILQELDLSVMTKKTYDYLFERGSGDDAYLFEKLRHREARKQKIWSPNFNEELKKTILDNVKNIDLTGYEVEDYLSLIEIIIEFNKETDAKIFPDANGVLRNLNYFKKVPDILSNLNLILEENREIHPKINWIEVGELTIEDCLVIVDEKYGNKVFTERNEEVEKLIKISSQLINSNKLDDTQRITYNYIICRRGAKIFLRPDNYVNICECGENYVATFLDDIFNCRDESCQGNIIGRSNVDWNLPAFYDRTAIYREITRTKPLEIIENKIMFSLVEDYGKPFTDTQIARYMAKKTKSNQESLFDDLELSNWLQEEEGMKLHEIKKIFLDWLKEFLLDGQMEKKGTDDSMSQALANVMYDSNNNWRRGREFILYSDEQLMEIINTKDKQFLIPHPELIENNRENNNWMEHPWIGVKKNIEWLHIQKKIKELTEAAFMEKEEKNPQLANLAIYLMKNKEIIPRDDPDFPKKEWIPLGKQIGFEEEYVSWGKFPAPVNSEWTEVTKRWRIQNTWDDKHISEYEYFKENDIKWIIESINSDKNFANDIGIRNSHDANRLFLALVETSQNYNASKDKSEPLSESYYRFLSQKLEEIPEKYLHKNYSLKFYDTNEKKWLYLGSLSSRNDVRPLLVNAKEYSQLEILNEDFTYCINIEKLSKETIDFLQMLGCKKSRENPEKMIELLSRYCDSYQDNEDFEKVAVARVLKKQWKNLLNMNKSFANFTQDIIIYTAYNNKPLKLSEIIIVDSENRLNNYEKDSNLIYNITKIAKYFNHDDEAQLLRFLKEGKPLEWDILRSRNRMKLSEEKRELIKKVPKEIFDQEITDENAVEWCKIINSIYWDFKSEIIVPIPYWDGEELKIEIPEINSKICILEGINPNDPRIEKFKKKGLKLVFSNSEVNVSDLKEYNSKADNYDDKFRRIIESMIDVNLNDINENDLSPSLDVEKYLKDILQALCHKMSLDDKDNDNPLRFMEMIGVKKTNVALSNTLKLLDFEIEWNQKKPWIINDKFVEKEESLIWPKIDCIYNPGNFTNYNNKNKFINDIIKTGLDKRLGKDNERTYTNQREMARDYLGAALGMENNSQINYEILTILSSLLEEDDPRKWSQIEDFENLKGIESIGPLVLNPNERESISRLKDWYSEDGCQICGRLTPDGPGSTDSQESRKKIWGKRGGLSRSGSFDDRSVGTWLYLCPSHSKLLERHCVKLYFILEGENEPVDSGKIVERFKQKDVVNLDHIKDTEIQVSVYERKEQNESDFDKLFDDESDNSPKWGDVKKLEVLDEEHRKKIVLKFREYVSSKIGNK